MSLLASLVVLFTAVNPATADPAALGQNEAVIGPGSGPIGGHIQAGGHQPALDSNGQSPDGTGSRPNIVVLMIDDIAQMDDRVWLRMPTISHMFLDLGVRFTDYIGNDPLCCPGRANFLTGQRATHNGVMANDARLLDPTETIATEMQGVGYWTAISGKYLNRTELLTDKTPPGWDHTFIFGWGYRNVPVWTDGREGRPGGYTTDQAADAAVSFLKKAPADKPVFLLLTPFAVHADAPEGSEINRDYMPTPAARHVGDPRCAGIDPWNPPGYYEPDVSDKPAYIQKLPPTPRFVGGWPLTTVCETMLSADEELQRVRDELLSENRTNTLYVLTDDNGMTFGAHRWPTKNVPYATPMPLFFRWAGSSLLGNAPREENATVSNVDLAPTFCQLAGCEMGPYPNGFSADGMSFLSVLTEGADSLPRSYVYTQTSKWHGVRSTDSNPIGRWDYTEYNSGECELYDLANDPWELTNRCNDPTLATQQALLHQSLMADGVTLAPPKDGGPNSEG